MDLLQWFSTHLSIMTKFLGDESLCVLGWKVSTTFDSLILLLMPCINMQSLKSFWTKDNRESHFVAFLDFVYCIFSCSRCKELNMIRPRTWKNILHLRILKFWVCVLLVFLIDLKIWVLLMIGGGYVISPLPPQGGYPHRCLVKHMLTVDWKHWKTCWSPSRDKDITLRVLERVAGKLLYC